MSQLARSSVNNIFDIPFLEDFFAKWLAIYFLQSTKLSQFLLLSVLYLIIESCNMSVRFCRIISSCRSSLVIHVTIVSLCGKFKRKILNLPSWKWMPKYFKAWKWRKYDQLIPSYPDKKNEQKENNVNFCFLSVVWYANSWQISWKWENELVMRHIILHHFGHISHHKGRIETREAIISVK